MADQYDGTTGSLEQQTGVSSIASTKHAVGETQKAGNNLPNVHSSASAKNGNSGSVGKGKNYLKNQRKKHNRKVTIYTKYFSKI